MPGNISSAPGRSSLLPSHFDDEFLGNTQEAPGHPQDLVEALPLQSAPSSGSLSQSLTQRNTAARRQ